MSGSLHIFAPGESAQVAENLNADFAYLLSLINAQGAQAQGRATGTSTTNYVARVDFVSIAASVSSATVLGQSTPQAQRTGVGAATATATDSVKGSANSTAVGAATGTSSTVGIASNSSVAAATGAATSSVVGLANISRVGAATGTSTAAAVGLLNSSSLGTGTGTSTASATGQGGATESADPTSATQPTQIIFASSVPGQTSAILNSFTLPANPGGVFVNNVADTNTSVSSGIVELYYTGHVVYAQTQSNTWFRWTAANSWSPTTSPIPAVIAESVEGAQVTASTQTIYASTNPGVAAPAGATVGNGLETWTLTANPGFAVRNGITQDGTGGTSLTQNVQMLYYHQHRIWQENTDPNWWAWDGTTPWVGPQGSPIPTTPTINVAAVPTRVNLNETFTVSGTYQAFAGTGNPTLQYADNIAQGASSTFNPSDVSASITLTNSNQTATASIAARAGVRSNTLRSTGKLMFEMTMGTVAPNMGMGIANASFQFTTNIGDDSNAIGFRPNWTNANQAVVFNGNTLSSATTQTDANGDKVTICVDLNTETFWVTSTRMRTAGNTWNNSPTANPGTNTGGLSFALDTGPYYVCLSTGDATGAATLNTAGPFAVAIPSGFAAWDSTAATSYQALPAGASVSATSFSFVHPAIAALHPAANVSVRDAVSTGVVGVSNNFQVAQSGVVTLFPMQLVGNSFQAGQGAGQTIGTLTIPAAGGTFTGTVSTTDPSRFVVNGSGGSRTLATASVVGAGTYNITLTATMANAVNSGETLAVTLTAGAESPQATDVTTTGVNVIGSSTPGTAGSQLTWALVTGAKISLNGVTQNAFSNAVELYYINHKLYMKMSTTPVTWSVYNGASATGGQLAAGAFTSSSDPHPVIQLNKTSFPPGTNGPTGITASLVAAADTLPSVTWSDDSASFTFSGNSLNTTGSLPAGTYTVNITGSIPA